MGLTYSFLAAEKKTWIEHNIHFDHSVRLQNLAILQNIQDGEPLYLVSKMHEWGSIKFAHWVITDAKYVIEFGSPNMDVYSACVTINILSDNDLDIDEQTFKTTMSPEIRERIQLVLGMNNYSLCLRNCEHVANFIARGRWVSHQMDANQGILMNYFRSYLMDDRIRLVNSFPSNIRPHIFSGAQEKKVYSFMEGNFVAKQFSYYLDHNEDTYNILVVGPTGAGKSHLINVIFNQKICDSTVSHHSVTREIYFIRGQGEIFDIPSKTYKPRNLVVADTIGLCDTEWEDGKILNLIKGRVSANIKHVDLVLIVFKADRLTPQHIQNIKHVLKWLKYEKNWLRILFVSTYAEHLPPEKKDELRAEAMKIFGIIHATKFSIAHQRECNALIYTGFPPEEALNDLIRKRCQTTWNELQRQMKLPGNSDRITLEPHNSACAIL